MTEHTASMQDKHNLTAEEVLDYLSQHPDFLQQHPHAIEWLNPPAHHTGKTVIDFQQYSIQHLQQCVQDAKHTYGQVVEVARDNYRMQAQVQQAVLQLVKTRTLEQLLECLCMEFVQTFNVDVIRLGLESDMGGLYESYYPENHYSGMVFIPVGASRELFQDSQKVSLVADSAQDIQWPLKIFFHECGDLAVSAAYMRLHLPSTDRYAVLAFGTRQSARFQSGQGTGLLQFLSDIVAVRLDQCLDEQAGLL